MLWDITISKSFDRYLQRGRVTGARNTQITISVTLTVTLAIEQVSKEQGCAWRDDQFGRGQNTVLGWSDPTFAHGSVAKVTRGSLQPDKNFFGARGENLDEAGEEGRNYVLQLRLHHLLLLVNLISLGKTRK
jgi:hypothetical protein